MTSDPQQKAEERRANRNEKANEAVEEVNRALEAIRGAHESVKDRIREDDVRGAIRRAATSAVITGMANFNMQNAILKRLEILSLQMDDLTDLLRQIANK